MLDVFVNTPLIEVPLPAAAPVTEATVIGTGQLYIVPAGRMVLGGLLVGDSRKELPLQIEVVRSGSVGLGFTVTVTVKGCPIQDPAVGVTVYTIV